jgi:hypothetical protein
MGRQDTGEGLKESDTRGLVYRPKARTQNQTYYAGNLETQREPRGPTTSHVGRTPNDLDNTSGRTEHSSEEVSSGLNKAASLVPIPSIQNHSGGVRHWKKLAHGEPSLTLVVSPQRILQEKRGHPEQEKEEEEAVQTKKERRYDTDKKYEIGLSAMAAG